MPQLSKKFAAFLYVPLTAPSLLLFIFAVIQEPIEWLFIGLGVVLLVFNALMLMLVYKWLLNMASEPVEEPQDGEEV